MNTPSHLLVNLAVLGGDKRGSVLLPVAAGALIPDLPMFVFYAYQKMVAVASEAVIWNDLYFRPDWQAFFDLFNSIPFAVVGILVANYLHHRGWALLFASVLLHTLCDLPLHHEDAHRHFFPFHYRFQSPVSYWDPRRHGSFVALAEVGLVIFCAGILGKRTSNRVAIFALSLVSLLYVAAYFAIYLY